MTEKKLEKKVRKSQNSEWKVEASGKKFSQASHIYSLYDLQSIKHQVFKTPRHTRVSLQLDEPWSRFPLAQGSNVRTGSIRPARWFRKVEKIIRASIFQFSFFHQVVTQCYHSVCAFKLELEVMQLTSLVWKCVCDPTCRRREAVQR